MLDLLQRIEEGEGEDRELDAEIAVALSGDDGAWVVNPSPYSVFSPVPGWWRTSDDVSHNAPTYTSSVDAVLALIEAKLPGAVIGLEYDGVRYRAEIPARPSFVGRHREIPRALLAAALRALNPDG